MEGREFAADILIKPVPDSTVLRSIAAILQRKQGVKPLEPQAPGYLDPGVPTL